MAGTARGDAYMQQEPDTDEKSPFFASKVYWYRPIDQIFRDYLMIERLLALDLEVAL